MYTKASVKKIKSRQKKFREIGFSIEYVKEYLESVGCELLSDTYENTKSKIYVLFPCGHKVNTTLGDIRNGHGCLLCGKERALKTFRENVILRIKNKMEECGFEFLGFKGEYKNRDCYLEFICQEGHYNCYKTREFFKSPTCRECGRIFRIESYSGRGASNWQGGYTLLRDVLLKKIVEWKKESMKDCNYKCVISGDRFDDIHHLYSFNLILKESVSELGLEMKETIGEYSQDEILSLIFKVKEIHKRYPLGVCLRKDIHEQFHKEYGYGDTTPDQFYEFKRKNL